MLSEKRLLDRLRTDAGRFRKHAQVAQTVRHTHDEFGIIDEPFAHEAVQQIDAAFVVRFVTGDVVATDQVVDRPVRDGGPCRYTDPRAARA